MTNIHLIHNSSVKQNSINYAEKIQLWQNHVTLYKIKCIQKLLGQSVSQSTMQFWLKTNNMQVHKLIPIQTCGQRRRQKISPHHYGDDKIGRLVAVTTCAQLKYRQQVCSR